MLTCTINRLLLGLLATGLITRATAQEMPSGTISLFRPAPIAPPSGVASNPGPALGMRPETVGAVSYRALSVDAVNTFRTRNRAPQTVQVALPGGRSVACALSSEVATDGLLVMSGLPEGGGVGDRCELIVENGLVTGIIDIPDGRYSIRPLEGGNAHAVVQIKTEAFPNRATEQMRGAEDRVGPSPKQTVPMCDVPPGPGQQPKSFGPIRVLIAYTPAASKESRSIASDIQIMMLQFRQVISSRLTGGNFSVSTELAHSVEVPFSEERDSPNMHKDLERLTDPEDPIFKTIHALRDIYKADLVHLVTKSRKEDPCGLGWTLTYVDRSDYLTNDKWGFSVSDRQCAVQDNAFAHELGHNIGMRHDRSVTRDAKPGPEEFNFGHVLLRHGVRTLMAYDDACRAAGRRCRELLIFSNPNIMYPTGGSPRLPLGQPLSAADAAYNAEILCRNADIVSKFR